ncbi:MAG: hypothetical protein IKP28_03430 [Clostridia bacterium]|nr:hypothetical protein [Clostridia bacterium]
MLIKLLKYDLKYMLKNMAIFYILSIFFATVTRILFNIDQSVIVNIIAQISMGCMISMIASTLINTMMRSWVRFRDSLYKDEAYLTHTLPVTKKQLYNSKFLQTLIFFFISFAVIILSLFIAFYSKDNWAVITEYIKTITTGLNMSTLFFVLMAILLIFLEVFNAIQCGFLGIILGHRRNNGKLGFSVLFGFVAYLIAQTLVLALVFVYGVFDSTVMELFKTATINIDVDAFKILAIVSSLLYLVIILSMSILCKRILNKGVNIE